MGQQLFKVHLDIENNTLITSDINLDNVDKDDISLFFSSKLSDPTELKNDHQISNSQIGFVEQIRNHLFILIKPISWEEINNEINQILMNNISTSLTEHYKKVIK